MAGGAIPPAPAVPASTRIPARLKRLTFRASRRNITAISVGHRPTLRRFHAGVLTLDGRGGCSITKHSLCADGTYDYSADSAEAAPEPVRSIGS